MGTSKASSNSAKSRHILSRDGVYSYSPREVGDDEGSYGDISAPSLPDPLEYYDNTRPEQPAATRESTGHKKNSSRYTTTTFNGDEESPSSLSFMMASKEKIDTIKRTRICYWLGAVVCLALFAFGVYILLYFMGWLPSVGRNQYFQGTVSSSQVALHDTQDDCWVIYYDKVYVMTEYATRHPGGASIITNFCGTDGTAAYENYHPKSLLKSVQSEFIGTLVQNSGSDSGSAVGSSSSNFAVAIQMSEVNTHSTSDNCWVVYHNQVYDMTDYAREHPGGRSVITSGCGSDSTDAYAKVHPESLLSAVKQYLVGEVVDDSTSSVSSGASNSQQQGNSDSSSSSSDCVTRGISLAQVQQHSNSDDCWSIYHDVVYDMTYYQHPRNFVTSQCGKDGTDSFNANHPTNYLAFVEDRQLGVLSDVDGDVACP